MKCGRFALCAVLLGCLVAAAWIAPVWAGPAWVPLARSGPALIEGQEPAGKQAGKSERAARTGGDAAAGDESAKRESGEGHGDGSRTVFERPHPRPVL